MRPIRSLFLAVGAALGTFYPFIVVILQQRGLGPAEIGAATAASSVAFAIAVPAWGHLGDVTLGRVRALQVGAICSAGVVLVFGMPLPVLVAAALIVAFSLFESSFSPLSDALALATVRDRNREYARVRLLSSFSFAVTSIACGALFERTGYWPATIIFGAAAAWIVLSVALVRDVPRARLESIGPRIQPPGLTRAPGRGHGRFGSTGVALSIQPRLPAVLLAIGLVHVGILIGFTFLPLRLVALGGGPADVALSAGIAALAEVPAMLVAGAIAARVGLRGLFALACVGYAACLASWIVLDAPTTIVATRVITGFGFAGVAIASALALGALLPVELQATGQALLQTVAFGIAAVAANLGGGLIYAGGGPGPLFAVGAAAALAAALLGWFVMPRRGESAVGAGPPAAAVAAEREVPFGV